MAQKNRAALNAQADVIKNEKTSKANSSTRLGQMMNDLADSQSNKIDDPLEIIDRYDQGFTDLGPISGSIEIDMTKSSIDAVIVDNVEVTAFINSPAIDKRTTAIISITQDDTGGKTIDFSKCGAIPDLNITPEDLWPQSLAESITEYHMRWRGDAWNISKVELGSPLVSQIMERTYVAWAPFNELAPGEVGWSAFGFIVASRISGDAFDDTAIFDDWVALGSGVTQRIEQKSNPANFLVGTDTEWADPSGFGLTDTYSNQMTGAPSWSISEPNVGEIILIYPPTVI